MTWYNGSVQGRAHPPTSRNILVRIGEGGNQKETDMRYNKASLDDTIRVANVLARKSNATAYITPTAYGWSIQWADKVPWLEVYRVTSGRVEHLDKSRQIIKSKEIKQ